MILIIDNYDSFTYNLAQSLGAMGMDIIVLRNDTFTLEDLAEMNVKGLVVSPGPGEPVSAGMSMAAIRYFKNRIPVLGICLGHQAICALFGGKVIRASRLMHGKMSSVYHHGDPIFRKVTSPFDVMRYHSLLVEKESLPAELEIIAESSQGEIMGVRHRLFNQIIGLQFHPESLFTPSGSQILLNFCQMLEPVQEKPNLFCSKAVQHPAGTECQSKTPEVNPT